MKTCSKCKRSLSLDSFHRHALGAQGRRSNCRECTREYAKDWRKKNRDRNAALGKASYRKHRTARLEWGWRWKLKARYGMTAEEYGAMLVAQGGLCAICRRAPSGRHKRLVIDHDHVTGRVRGLLCRACNSAIGYFMENVLVVEAAVAYLRRVPHE